MVPLILIILSNSRCQKRKEINLPAVDLISQQRTPRNYQAAHHNTMSTSRPRSCSKGEELWQIHLQRAAAVNKDGAEDDDHDYPEPRHPKRSIGEELFEVHLKRAKGIDPDYDADDAKVEKEEKSGNKAQ